MSIVVHERDSKLGVAFPFALKDSFRSAFPSAKWDPRNKEWLVGKSIQKRVDGWIIEAAKVAEELKVDEDVEMTEREVVELRAAIRKLETKLQENGGAIARLEKAQAQLTELASQRDALLIKLQESDADIAAAEARKAEAAKLAGSKRREIEAIMNKACDMSAINSAITRLCNAYSYRSRGNHNYREQYEQAQADLRIQRNALREAGWESSGLATLCGLNYNRPDRDDPNDVTAAKIAQLTPYEIAA